MTAPAVGHRLVLDVQALQSPHHAERGIGRYVGDHAAALLAAGAPVEALALNPSHPAPATPPAALAGSGLLTWNTPAVVRDAAERGPVAYHVMSPFEDLRPVDGIVAPHGLRGADALVVTLYDAIPFVMPEAYQRGWWARQFLRRRARLVDTADLVLTISESTARDAVDVLGVAPERVAVIGGAASDFFRPEQPGDDSAGLLARALPQLRRPFVMSVSGDDPRKDPDTLIEAFAMLPPDVRREHQLVIACTLVPAAEAKWRGTAHRHGLHDADVVFTGYVADDVLRALYRRAAVFTFTSRYEGFGLPVLEAARCGTPAITTASSSLPEILDCPASTFPPGDAAACADTMARAITDDDLRTELRVAGEAAARRHTWDAVARRTLDAYARLPVAPGRHRRRALPPRVALVGPFPPAWSGVADYNERVAEELGRLCELDCFVEVDPGEVRETPMRRERPFRRFPVLALGRTISPGSYDALVYTVGNSRYHRRTLELALRHPGVVWMHDANLAGLHLTAAGLYLPGVPTERIDFDRARAVMRGVVERCAGPGHDLGDDWWKPEAYVEAGLSLTEEALRAARRIVVSTEAARRLLDEPAAGTPIELVPLAVPSVPEELGAYDAADPEPLIVSLGVVSSVKLVEELIHALAAVRRSIPARLAFVGNADAQYAAELAALARELGVGDAVVTTGYVSAGEYRDWLGRAALVVQLRRRTVGEGSAAVADAIAAGRPVLTSVGAAHELPEGIVELIDPDADVDELAARITALLADADRRTRLATAARGYAREWTFGHVAREILDLAMASPAPAFPG